VDGKHRGERDVGVVERVRSRRSEGDVDDEQVSVPGVALNSR